MKPSTLRRLFLLSILFILSLPPVYAQCPWDFPGILKGKVTDEWTGVGIDGVMVRVYDSSTSKSTTTFSGGWYKIDMPAGSYNVTFSKPGYLNYTKSVDLSCGQYTYVNPALTPETGYISVNCTPSGSSIFLNGSLQEAVTPTTLTVRAETYIVSVSKEGYFTSSQTVDVEKDSTTEISCALEEVIYGVSLTGDKSYETVYSNEEAVYTLTVKNTGNTQDTYDLTHTNLDNVVVSLNSSSVTLKAEVSTAISLKVKSSVAGVYTVKIIVTSRSNASISSEISLAVKVISSSGSSATDLTIFREEISTEYALLDFMHGKGDAYGSKHAFGREMAPLASLYAARGENVMSLEMADTLLATYSGAKTGMLRVEKGDIYQLAVDYILGHYSSPGSLIIARGDLAMDSLVATPLSDLLNAPILLVEPSRIPEPDFRVLDHRYEMIYIIGGPVAVSKAVEQGLSNYSDTIIRLWGDTRYETAIEVAKEVRKLRENNLAILTNGEKPVLYSASLSKRYRAPILYLNTPPVMQSIGKNPHQEAVSRYISEQALDIGMIYYNDTIPTAS